MRYASIEDLKSRSRKVFSPEEEKLCDVLLEDAGAMVDAYNANAPEEAKKIVSCTMILRTISNDAYQVPVGSTQGTVSALGYSQTWTMGSGSTGELYLSKADKKLLKTNSRLGFASPY